MKNIFAFKNLFLAMAAFMLSFAAVSCSEDETSDSGTPTVSLSIATSQFDSTEHSDCSLEVSANRDWTVSSSADWLTITTESGSGNGTVYFSMTANDSELARTANITVSIYNSYGTIANKSVAITQADAEGNTDGGTYTDGNFLLDGSVFPTAESSTAEYIVADGVTFEVASVYYSSSYNNYVFTASTGYISNYTSLDGLKKVVVTEDYSYYNLSLYAGTSFGATTTLVSYTKSDDDDYYVYEIPEGSTFITIKNASTYKAYADAVEFIFDDSEAGDTDYSEDLGVITTAEFRSKASVGDKCTLENVVVDYLYNGYIFASADDVSINIYDYEFDDYVSVGDKISITGTYASYSEMIQLVSIEQVGETISTGNEIITPTVATVTEINAAGDDAVAQLYEFSDVTLSDVFTSSSSAILTMSQDDAEIKVVNKLGAAALTDMYTSYTVTGYVVSYYGVNQIYPISVEATGDIYVDENEGLGTTLTMADFEYIWTDAGVTEASGAYYDLSTTETYTVNGFNFNFAQDTGSIAARLHCYSTSFVWQLRVYGTTSNIGSMTISAVDNSNITKIILTTSAGPYFTVDSGDLDGSTWTGSASSVTFTGQGISDGTTYITAIQIITDGESGETTDPEITDPEETTDPADLSITSTEVGSSYTSSSTLTGVTTFGDASFYVSGGYVYTTGGVSYISTTYNGYIYNLTAFEGLEKVVITYSSSTTFAVYEGTEANSTESLITPTAADGNVYTYAVTSGNKYITIVREVTGYPNASSVDFYYESLGETAEFVEPVVFSGLSSAYYEFAYDELTAQTVTINGEYLENAKSISVVNSNDSDFDVVYNEGEYTFTVAPKASNISSADLTATITVTVDDTAKTMVVKQNYDGYVAAATSTWVVETSDLTTASYSDNNGEHTKSGIGYYTNQVYQNSSKLQWQKNTAYLYNTTALTNISKIELTDYSGAITVYVGSSENPTSGTVIEGADGVYNIVETGYDYFAIVVGGTTTYCTSVSVTSESTLE